MGSHFSLVYTSDPVDGLSSNVTLFADNTSLFSITHDVGTAVNELNNDLHQINEWDSQ